ncbi:STAS domain-containing protein [Marimonas sp. MJW-29]|uniref:Anti-sigma factor antagonist n=1 Tax=Sulfitobacter sediminis TaxID=3234186 RepID=A0ABV3RLS3_9RHOB
MEMSVRTEGDICIVSVGEPRIDAPAAVEFKETMRRLTQAAPPRVLLDLSEVTFIDSSGLGAIVGAMKQLAPAHSLELACLTPNVERVFRLTRLDSVFRIFASPEDALNAESA